MSVETLEIVRDEKAQVESSSNGLQVDDIVWFNNPPILSERTVLSFISMYAVDILVEARGLVESTIGKIIQIIAVSQLSWAESPVASKNEAM